MAWNRYAEMKVFEDIDLNLFVLRVLGKRGLIVPIIKSAAYLFGGKKGGRFELDRSR